MDEAEDRHHALADRGHRDLAELELEGVHDVLLLGLGLADEEHPRLGEVVEELLAAGAAHLGALDGAGHVRKPPSFIAAWNGQPPPSEFGS